MRTIAALLMLVGALWADPVEYVICEGDSLTVGYLASDPAFAYPAQMDLPGATVDNDGGNGATIQANNGATSVNAALTASSADRECVVLWFGINDIATNSRTTAQVTADLANFLSSVRTAHPSALIVGATITPTTSTASDPELTVRNDVNDWIRNTGDYDAVVDLAADARLDDPTDTTYYNADEVHFTDTGYGVVADLIQAGIETLFPVGASLTISGTLTIGEP